MPKLVAHSRVPRRSFAFSSLEEYNAKVWYNASLEFQFLDGTPAERDLFERTFVIHYNLHAYLAAAALDEQSQAKIAALMDCGRPIEDAIRQYENVDVEAAETPECWARLWIDNQGGPAALGEDRLDEFFDYDRFGRAMAAANDIVEFEIAGETHFILSHSID